MSLYRPDIFKSLWLESDHILPSDTAQFKGSPTSTVFDLTEHYCSLTVMEQRNKKPLQWKQQRGMAVKEVQTLWHQSCTFTLANTKCIISLCSSSVPATVSHPRVPPGTGRRQLHHRHPAPPTHVAPLKHQFKPVLALTSQVFFCKYMKQTLLQKVIRCCWFLVTLKSTSFVSC